MTRCVRDTVSATWFLCLSVLMIKARMVSCCTLAAQTQSSGVETQNPFFSPLLSVTPAAINKRHLIQPFNAPQCARGQTPRKKRTNTFLLIMCGTRCRSERGMHSVGKGPDSEPTANVVAHLHLPFFLAVSNAAEERLLRSSTGGKTIPLGFALPVSSQQRQKQRKKLRGEKNHYSLNEMSRA